MELTLNNKLPSTAINSGAVSIEQERAIAEAQGQLVLAKRFPRDLTAAHAELMDSCKLPSLASVAFYSVPRGGGSVTGPSIRLAEEIARVCGNIEYGHRELSRSEGKSEVEVFAWDKQTNTRSIRQLTIMHIRDTKNGPVHLRDQKDVDDLISNKASKQLRGRILAIVPKWLVEAATAECKKTIAGENKEKPVSVRIRDMAQAFLRFGVNSSHMESYLGHKLDETTLDELVELTGIYNSLKDGASRASDYFGSKDDKPVSQETKNLQAMISEAKPQEQKKAPESPQRKEEAKADPAQAPIQEDNTMNQAATGQLKEPAQQDDIFF